MLAAGRLQSRIELLRLVYGKDQRGQDVQRWQTVAKPWAQVQLLSGDEAIAAMKVNPTAQWRVNLRWRPDLDSRDRIAYDDGFQMHTLEILAVVDRYQRREELELTCGEVRP